MSDHAAFVGSIPELYDRHLGPVIFEQYAEDLARRVKVVKPRMVLESACGTGILTRQLARELGPDVQITATDLNEAMIAHARSAFPDAQRVTWRQADAMFLPFPDRSFDAIANQFGMMFMPDKACAIREARRVLQPGGLFAFNVWGTFAENPFGRIAHTAIAKFFARNPPTFYLTPFGWNDPDTIAGMMNAGGFEKVHTDKVAFSATAISAHDFAVGLVDGNPVVHSIREAGLDSGRVIEALTRELAAHGGDQPFRSSMRALVVVGYAA
jgi:ubiquinone/menaquinone biosynthesis C-methylase UbiE